MGMNLIRKYKKVIIIVCLFILAIITLAVVKSNKYSSYDDIENLDLSLNENNYYITEENYEDSMKSIVEPYLEEHLNDGYIFNGEASLYYQSYVIPESTKSIVMSHGFTEFTEKYTEVIYYYLKGGYSVYIMDYRGFGNSHREVEDKSLAYISDFKVYVNDLKFFMDSIVMPENKDKELYLYAHSMGGAIGVDFLENYPEYFDAAVLSAPLMKTNTGDTHPYLVSLITKLNMALGNDENYIIGHQSFNPEPNLEKSSALSNERYSYYFDKQINNENYQVYGSSYAWINASLKEINKVMKKSELEKIKIPVLLFQAETDSLVLPAGHYKFAETVDSAQLIYVAGSKHQVYSASDEIVIPYFNTIFNFLDEVSTN